MFDGPKGHRYEPMLSGKATGPPSGEEWVLEPKLDGRRHLVHISKAGKLDAWNRSGNTVTGFLPHVEDYLMARGARGIVLDGEIACYRDAGDGRLKADRGAVTSAVGRARPAPPEKVLEVSYAVFDLLMVEGEDITGLPLSERRELLDVLIPDSGGPVYALPQMDSKPEHHAAVMRTGFEGTVAKKAGSRYRPGRRAQTWRKIKPFDTLDVVITGFKMAEPGSEWDAIYDDDGEEIRPRLIGAAAFGIYENGELVPISRCSGMDMDERRAMTDRPDLYVGKVMEIQHYGETKDGSYTNPVFLGLRDDKRPEECTR